MILGVGTDIVSIKRFAHMSTLSHNRLRTFFSASELLAAQDFQHPHHFILAKLATRFAAKEALFKALSASLVRLGYTQKTFSLRFVAQISSVEITQWGVPELRVDCAALEQKIGVNLPPLQFHLSLSHEQERALAFVICETI